MKCLPWAPECRQPRLWECFWRAYDDSVAVIGDPIAPLPVNPLILMRVVLAQLEQDELLLKSWQDPDLFSGLADHLNRPCYANALGKHEICSYDSGTPGDTLNAVYETHAVRRHGLMDEPARRREVNEQVCIVDVLHRDPQVPVARRGVIRRDRLGADRHDVGDTAFREDPRGFRGINGPKEQSSFNNWVDVPPGGHG